MKKLSHVCDLVFILGRKTNGLKKRLTLLQHNLVTRSVVFKKTTNRTNNNRLV